MYFQMSFLGMFFLNRINNNIGWRNAGTIFFASYLPVTLWLLMH